MIKYPWEMTENLIKKLKILGLITILIVVVAAIAIGTIEYKTRKKPKNDILTLKCVVKTFKKQGMNLKEDSSKSPDKFKLGGVKPAVFAIGDKTGTLLVYTFKSFVERENIVSKSNKSSDLYSLQEYSFNAKNTFLIYIAAQSPTTEEQMNSIGETRVLISDIVFKYLNDGKVIIYKGNSTSWEGTFTLKYYEHWWADEKGKLHYDAYNDKFPSVKYKLADVISVGPINFEYKTTSGGGGTTGSRLNKEGYPNLGSSGGSGSGFSKDDDVTYTIKWNGKKENIILKAQE